MKLQELCKEAFPDKKVIYLLFPRNFPKDMTLEEKVMRTEDKILKTLGLTNMEEVPTKNTMYVFTTGENSSFFICQPEVAGFMAVKYNLLQLISEGLFYD